MVSAGDKEFLKDKKIKFLVEVEKSAEYLGVYTPRVQFWKGNDPSHFSEGERAHIHLESNIICISEQELEGMTYEDIEETASHEVAHLKDMSHDTNFQNIQNTTKASLWTPPSGLVFIDSNIPITKEEKEDKKKKEKPDKLHCNYHLCRKRTKTYQCKYCKRYFCKKHKKAHPMTFFLANRSDPTARALMEEYHKKEGHPCIPYNIYWEKKRKKEADAWGKTLDILVGKHKKRRVKIIEEDEGKITSKWTYEDDDYEPTTPTKHTRKKTGNFIKRHKFLTFLIILGIVLLISWKVGYTTKAYEYLADKSIGNNFLRSFFTSKYEQKELIVSAFVKLNSLRMNEGKISFQYDNEAYENAVFVSKKIYLNKEIQTDYFYVYDKMNHDEEDLPLEYEWDTLPNILNVKITKEQPNIFYNKGAIGCYKHVCSFVGAY